MTKWIVSAPLKGADLMKNFVCFTEVELRKLLEQHPYASVEMKDSHLEDYPEMKDYSLISTAQTENYIQVKDARYTLDEFNRIGEILLGRNLTDDQQVVLEWLKRTQRKENYPMGTITYIQDLNEDNPCFCAFENLSIEQEWQVLAAFAEWGSKGEER